MYFDAREPRLVRTNRLLEVFYQSSPIVVTTRRQVREIRNAVVHDGPLPGVELVRRELAAGVEQPLELATHGVDEPGPVE